MALDDLYREIILDHYQSPRGRGEMADASVRVHGHNPLCGDEVDVMLKIEDGKVADVMFSGRGCSISQASASMMSDRIAHQTRDEIATVKSAFESMLVAGTPPTAILGDLEAFEGVAKFPVRVKCALLPWKVLEQGLASPVNKGGTDD